VLRRASRRSSYVYRLSQMDVLVVTNMYPTEREPWFGAFVRDQVDDLRRRGLPIDVYWFDGRRQKRAYARAAVEIRRRAECGDFDLIHAHYGLSGAVALMQRRLPVVTTFHGSETGYIRWQWVISLAVARMTVPIFVSAQGAASVRCPLAAIIPVGVDTELFQPRDRDVVRESLGWDRGTPHVLFPGARANRRKRVDLFDATIDELERRGTLVRRVYLEGFTRRAAADVIAASDAVLMTSEWEGSPLAVREALASNVPVVSVEVGDVRDVLDGLPACAVTDRDPQILADALAVALAAPRDGRLRERALGTSRELVAERVESLYRQVATR
jgi:teichuronic acid biosynthesis glycosyltransferase TuaC